MQRKFLSILAGGALLFSATASAFAQGESGGATSGGATSGGATSGGAASEAPAPAAPEQNQETPAALPPAAAAGPNAPFLSDTALIGIGAAAVLAGVLIAVTSSSSSTTTTTAH